MYITNISTHNAKQVLESRHANMHVCNVNMYESLAHMNFIAA